MATRIKKRAARDGPRDLETRADGAEVARRVPEIREGGPPRRVQDRRARDRADARGAEPDADGEGPDQLREHAAPDAGGHGARRGLHEEVDGGDALHEQIGKTPGAPEDDDGDATRDGAERVDRGGGRRRARRARRRRRRGGDRAAGQQGRRGAGRRPLQGPDRRAGNAARTAGRGARGGGRRPGHDEGAAPGIVICNRFSD